MPLLDWLLLSTPPCGCRLLVPLLDWLLVCPVPTRLPLGFRPELEPLPEFDWLFNVLPVPDWFCRPLALLVLLGVLPVGD